MTEKLTLQKDGDSVMIRLPSNNDHEIVCGFQVQSLGRELSIFDFLEHSSER